MFSGSLIVELLEAERALVLRPEAPRSEIQADVYGHPRQQVRGLVTVPVFVADGTEFHPDFLDLDLL